jgi:hypothetical protein
MIPTHQFTLAPLRASLLSPLRLLAVACGILTALAAAFPAQAQQPAVANPSRITQPVDDTVLTTLKGNVHPLAKPRYDKGPANASLPADRMQLMLKRSPGQEIALRQFLGSLQNPNSAQYRKWLTPEQFGAQYGVSDADIQTVSAWLASQGFKINKVNKARTIIDFSGTVGQLQTAFHTQIHNYSVNGEQHLANAADPQIPAALTPVVAGLSRMNNFFAKPQHTKPIPGQFVKASGKFVPELTIGSAKDGYQLFVGPGDAATIYDAPNAFNSKFSGSTSYTGAGVSIGIIGVSNIATSDVDNYRSVFGLPAATPTVVVDGNDPGENGAELEALLDLEASGGLAPGATQTFYIGADTNLDSGLFLAADRAIDDNTVSIISLSFGECELALGESANEYLYLEWEQAAAQGITVLTSAGDGGSAGCDDFDTEESAEFGLQISGYASTPFNIAVGGTDYDALSTAFTQYVSTANGAHYTSALGYIPEEPWNNSTISNGKLSANTPLTDSTGATNIVAGSGGISSCVNPSFSGNNYTCLPNPVDGTGAGWTKPSWQTGGSLNIPSDGVRDIPDVSLLAGDGLYSASWLVCADFSGQTPTCAPDATGNFYWYGVGGTSASSPAFAGILALVSQSQGGARLGQANYVLYNLANQPGVFSSAFHDVTAGNNSVYCASGSLDCGTNLFETGYNAATAYDLASGLGSVDIAQLIKSWTKATFTSTTTTFTINGGTAPVSITHGQSVTLSASVAGAGGTPTGDVAIIGNANQQADTSNSNSLAGFTLSGGTTGSQSFSNLPGGTYTVSANYGGDIDYAESQSSGVQVTVAKENSIVELFAANGSSSGTPPASAPYGTYFSIEAQPVGVSQENSDSPAAATGVVTFSDTAGIPAGTSPTVNINSNGYAELPVYYYSGGSHSITASYAGDNSLNPSSGSVNFTITQAPTTSAVSTSSPTVASGTFTVTSLITPTPLSPAANPSGTVTLTVSGKSIGTGVLVPAADANGNSIATAAIIAAASSLAPGANTITATYAGDTNYAGSSGTVVVTSTATPSITITGTAPAAVTVGGSTTSTVTVSPANGFTGGVNLSATIAPSGSTSPTLSFNPATVTISGTTAATSTLTIATTSATTAGAYTVTLNAADTATGKVTATSTITATVNGVPKLQPTVALSLSATAINTDDPLTATATVTGAGVAPTGTVAFSSGSYTSAAQTLSGGTVAFTIPGGSLSAGTDTITATYSGDGNYNTGTGTASVTVTQSTFTVAGTSSTFAAGATSGNTSTITATSTDDYAGTVNLTCALTTPAPGANSSYNPTCALSPTSAPLTSGGTGTSTATFTSTARTTSELAYPKTNRWYTAAGGAALACIVFFGIPARRRSWRSMLGLLIFLVTVAGIGCGGGGGGTKTTTGTTAGTYTFTVTGTDSKTSTITASGTITVTVQ